MQSQSDGHTKKITEDNLLAGCVIRMVNSDGGVSPFSDTVVTAIVVEAYGCHKTTHIGIREALEYVSDNKMNTKKDFSIQVHLARPYLYASTIGICVNHLSGVEAFSVEWSRLAEDYQVVVDSFNQPSIFSVRH